MTQVIKNNYDSPSTITITLGSLASGNARQSAAVDNSSALYLDVLVQLKIKSGAASNSVNGYANVYAYGTADGGTDYAEGATGSDASITLNGVTNLRLIGTINFGANATTYVSEPMSVAAAFGGILPQKWGIVVENQTGGSFDSTEGNHAKLSQGVWAQAV